MSRSRIQSAEVEKLPRDFDVIVVGAGIVGPAAAVGFAREGRSVLVIERDLREPDRIVGELLQPGGVAALEKLGMRQCLDGIDAVDVYGYQVVYDGTPVHVPYPVVDSKTEKRAMGKSFHHGRFVANLRKAAVETAGVSMLEATVNDLVKNPHTGHVLGVKCTDKSGHHRHFFAPLTVVTDGISSKFRKEFVSRPPDIKSHFAGLILKDADLPARNHGHVIIGPTHQPILVYQVDSRETRILCDISGPLPSNASGALHDHLVTKVLPNLPKSLQPSFTEALASPQRIRTMPSQYLPASLSNTPGVVLLGDAFNMRHPLTGGGMTVGLTDAALVSELLGPKNVASLGDSSTINRQMHRFFMQRKNIGSVVNVLSVALYALFAGSTEDLRILQRGCVRYFQLGGARVSEPAGLLAGILPRPIVLFYHFFSVAFYAIYVNAVESGLAALPQSFLRLFTVLWTASVVFLPYLWLEARWY